MKLDVNELSNKLEGACKDSESSQYLAAKAVEVADGFEGSPDEFFERVKATAKAENQDFKFNPEGGHSVALRVLKEAFSGSESSSASGVGDPPPVSNNPPATKSSSQKKKPGAKTTKVALSEKIAAYGGQFYDYESKTWINGTEDNPQEVTLTNFIQRKVGLGELIEIRD